MMADRSEQNWKDFVANKLREQDARHSASEAKLDLQAARLAHIESSTTALTEQLSEHTKQLANNTATTIEIKADTADIREAMIGIRWLGKVARWFIPVSAFTVAIAAILQRKS